MNMDECFIPVRFETSVQLKPKELVDNIDNLIITKLRRKLEAVCTRFGYIKKGSLTVIGRSLGLIMMPHFNGHVKYNVHCHAQVFTPMQGRDGQKGTIVPAKVTNKNNYGLFATSALSDGTIVLEILVPKKSAGIESEINPETLNIGDDIFVEVIGKKYQLKESRIAIVGRCVRSLDADASAASVDGADGPSMVLNPYGPGGIPRPPADAADVAEVGDLEAENIAVGLSEVDGDADADPDAEDLAANTDSDAESRGDGDDSSEDEDADDVDDLEGYDDEFDDDMDDNFSDDASI
jgi:DNA-directed RNA polymerase subunit E'/Rpb7